MTSSAEHRVPNHLKKYVVQQNYEHYTPEDQAVWRFIMRQLKDFLGKHAHESYLEGLKKTGIIVERIPRISEIDQHLEKFGWGAVPVSGFIPPAAFMEFQSLGILPIASDMRTLDHLQYTPAPDIVHEAAGHAPILIHPEFAAYLRKYAEVASHAILSKEDLEQYEAIRILSDVKEDPSSTPADIARAESELQRVNNSMRYVSEGGLLSRMNWWTAEYGLIGDLKNPRIFGAGLLSSVGESRECLGPKVKKIPLTIDCVNFSYDITEPQPQLFVTPDFKTLHDVLDQLANRLAFRLGGAKGLEQAVLSQALTTVQLNSGLQISGQLENYHGDGRFLKFSGPCQLSVRRREVRDQGVQRHAHGYSSPVGLLQGLSRCLSTFSESDLKSVGVERGRASTLTYQSGITVSGTLKDLVYDGDRLVLLTFENCLVKNDDQVLFEPSWGEYDLAVGSSVPAVFGGPADREHFGATDDFVAKRVPPKNWPDSVQRDFQFFEKTRRLREMNSFNESDRASLTGLIKDYVTETPTKWLKGIELLELSHKMGLSSEERGPIEMKLKSLSTTSASVRQCIEDGLRLSPVDL